MIFTATLEQMAFLFSLIIIGYILMKLKFVPDNSNMTLSKLENYLFIPALVLSTFMGNFTLENLSKTGQLLAFSSIVAICAIILAFTITRFTSKDAYIRNITLYGLSFSNFGFMGYAIVNALFPSIAFEYVIFTLVLWVLIYVWGVPSLLMAGDEKLGIKARLKRLVNPMFICMLVGMIIGLSGVKMPLFITKLVDSTADCMSPLAMLITGMVVAKVDIKSVLKSKDVYIASVLRLLVFPLLFIGLYYLIGVTLPSAYLVSAVCSLSMPLGLNTIVIPSAYGKDTTVPSGMALVSHVLSILTIPLIFTLIL